MTSLDDRLFKATVGTLELFGVYLGTRLGLYRVLSEDGPRRPAELAAAAGIDQRYAREWLEQQAVAGMVTVDESACRATNAATGCRPSMSACSSTPTTAPMWRPSPGWSWGSRGRSTRWWRRTALAAGCRTHGMAARSATARVASTGRRSGPI